MTQPYWHVGILVHNLEAAIEKFSKVLGIAFQEPAVTVFEPSAVGPTRLEEDAPGVTPLLRSAFSLVGPPYIELNESSGTGIFGPQNAEGLHHIGLWSDDNVAEKVRLESAGVRINGTVFWDDGSIQALFTRPDDLYGIRLAYVNSQNRTSIESFISTGKY
jgi:catechol 2,3-dioxygenase-like lactoylglutathione lyase family enzyme